MTQRTLFNAADKNPFMKCHLTGASDIFLVNAPEISSRVLKLSQSSSTSKIELSLKNVHHKQLPRYMGMLLKVPHLESFKFTLRISSKYSHDYHIYFSTTFTKTRKLQGSAWIPLSTLKTGCWVNFIIDMHSFTDDLGAPIKICRLESIAICSSCYLSRVFICSVPTPVQTANNPLDMNVTDAHPSRIAEPITQLLNVTTVRLLEWKLLGTTLKSVYPPKACTPNLGLSTGVHTEKSKQPSVVKRKSGGTRISARSGGRPVMSSGTGEPALNQTLKSNQPYRFCSGNQRGVPLRLDSGESDTNSGLVAPHTSLAESEWKTSFRCRSAGPLPVTSYHVPPDGTNLSEPVSDSNHPGNRICSVEPPRAIRLGNLYLFNSLPQPTPYRPPNAQILANPPGWLDNRLHSFSNFDSILLTSSQNRNDSTQPERVSVDRQFLQPITQTELRMKAILTHPGKKSTFQTHPIRGTQHSNTNPVQSTGSEDHAVLVVNSAGQTTPQSQNPAAAPLDLGQYEHTEDLSDSFEASLLASLKAAAMGGSGMRQSELEMCMMEYPGRKSPFMQADPSGDASPDCVMPFTRLSHKPPVPKQTEALPTRSRQGFHRILEDEQQNERSQRTDFVRAAHEHSAHSLRTAASFSDDESSLATTTTTAGLGSLIDFPYARKRPVKSVTDREQKPAALAGGRQADALLVPQSVDDLSVLSPSTPIEMEFPVSRMDSVDDTSLLLTKTEYSDHSEFAEPVLTEWKVTSTSSGPNLQSECASEPARTPERLRDDNHQIEAEPRAVAVDSVDPEWECVQDKLIQLLYDPILECYYDPQTETYYDLK